MKVVGRNAVEEALKSKNSIDKVLVQNGMRDEPSRKVLNRIRVSINGNKGCCQYAQKQSVNFVKTLRTFL